MPLLRRTPAAHAWRDKVDSDRANAKTANTLVHCVGLGSSLSFCITLFIGVYSDGSGADGLPQLPVLFPIVSILFWSIANLIAGKLYPVDGYLWKVIVPTTFAIMNVLSVACVYVFVVVHYM